MNPSVQTGEYGALIRKIRRNRRIVIVSTVIAVLTAIAVCSPMYIELAGKMILDYKGIHPALTVLIVIFIFFCEWIAYAVVSAPLTTSMDLECDPQKHLILNTALNQRKPIPHIYAVDYFYMGCFGDALSYANQMIGDKHASAAIIGLFHKARCAFFMGDVDALKHTVGQYKAAVSDIKKTSQKTKTVYDKIQRSLDLLLAIADGDTEKIEIHRQSVEAWNPSKATQGYINYLKGVAAYYIGDKEESIYRLMLVKDACGKTVLAGLADRYLAKGK